MNVVLKNRVLNFFIDILSMFCVFISISCIILKLVSHTPINPEKINTIAAKTIFFRGNFQFENIFKNSSNMENFTKETNTNIEQKIENNINNETQSSADNNKVIMPPEIPEEEQPHAENDKKCIITEKHISGGEKYENFYVKNNAHLNIDFNEYLNKSLDLQIRNNSDPQVLIMHTHTSESYMLQDLGFFYESFYPRSLDNSKNVTRVGQEITDTLIKNGINTIHSTVYHDNPSYNGSYQRSAKTIKENLEKYPSIKVVIDIHRDSMGSKEFGKVKPTFNYNGHKAAQLMIISGCDPDGSADFPNWNKNLSFALKLQKYCENLFPGITRPLNFSKVKYNENLTSGSLLIEIGSDVNTLKESVFTGKMLGEALSKLLNDIKK